MSQCHLGVVQREKVTATGRVEFPMEMKEMKEITHANLFFQTLHPLCVLLLAPSNPIYHTCSSQYHGGNITNTPHLSSGLKTA